MKLRTEVTAEMRDAGAQRLLRLGELPEGADWLEEFSGMQIASAREDAERVWLSMREAQKPTCWIIRKPEGRNDEFLTLESAKGALEGMDSNCTIHPVYIGEAI